MFDRAASVRMISRPIFQERQTCISPKHLKSSTYPYARSALSTWSTRTKLLPKKGGHGRDDPHTYRGSDGGAQMSIGARRARTPHPLRCLYRRARSARFPLPLRCAVNPLAGRKPFSEYQPAIHTRKVLMGGAAAPGMSRAWLASEGTGPS